MDNNNYINEHLLLNGLKKGSEGAYEYFFGKYYKELCNYLLAICGNSELAEEIAQQAFVNFWDRRKKIDIKNDRLKPYFFRMAYNLFIDSKRNELKKYRLLEKLKQEAYSEVVELDNVQYENRLKLVQNEIENLPEQCKKVFILGKKHGLKYKEISEQLHISVKTVEIHMSKALKRLRTQLTIFL
ncbi:MAG: RNA polymerase sigma-70 factor [Maribacter dokdonensis]|uniref:RNA polymerase sigma factor n=1 Tax=Maribacter dokdonensis TaxID=320912 RepID=UPI00329703F8